MASQRPISDSFHLGSDRYGSSGGVGGNASAHLRNSVGGPNPAPASRPTDAGNRASDPVNAARPTSDIYLQASTNPSQLNSAKGAFPTAYHGQQQASQVLRAQSGGLVETDVIDRWFEDLNQFQRTLEEMATASLDPTFKEELTAIEQWFGVLSEAERTATLYALLHQISPVQIRFFMTILQQKAQRDPMNALLAQIGQPTANTSLDETNAGDGSSVRHMLDRHSIALDHGSLGDGANSRMNSSMARLSASSTNLAGMANNGLGLNPAASLAGSSSISGLYTSGSRPVGNASGRDGDTGGVFSNRWSLSSLGPNTSSASGNAFGGGPLAGVDPYSNRNSGAGFPGATDPLGLPMWRRPDLGFDRANNANGPRGGKFDRPGSAMSNEKPLASNRWGFASSTNIATMVDNNQTTERPKSATELDLDDWQSLNLGRAPQQRQSTGPGVKSTLRHSLGSNPSGEAGDKGHAPEPAAGPADPAQAVAASHDAPSGGGSSSLASRRLGAHKFSVAVYDRPEGSVPTALRSPLKSPLFSPGLKGSRASGSRPTTPAMPPGLHPPQSPWSTNFSDIGSMKQHQNAAALRSHQLGLAGDGYGATGPYGPNAAHHRINSPIRGKFPPFGGPPGAAGYPPTGPRSGLKVPMAPQVHGGSTTGGNAPAKMPTRNQEAVDMKLLEDIPAWLKSLRLHKYTPCFQNIHWRDMVRMTDEDLTAKGVAALGARRKMLKVFDSVRQELEANGEPLVPAEECGVSAVATAATDPAGSSAAPDSLDSTSTTTPSDQSTSCANVSPQPKLGVVVE
ncbi:Flap-structured DNA-binding and RNA-binding protein [Dimargaris xerosporica]|nr:Flap-structured DNA-binding and RNA-binding protein [Dimargaris xerosporica]